MKQSKEADTVQLWMTKTNCSNKWFSTEQAVSFIYIFGFIPMVNAIFDTYYILCLRGKDFFYKSMTSQYDKLKNQIVWLQR